MRLEIWIDDKDNIIVTFDDLKEEIIHHSFDKVEDCVEYVKLFVELSRTINKIHKFKAESTCSLKVLERRRVMENESNRNSRRAN